MGECSVKYCELTHKKLNELEDAIKENKSKGELLDLLQEVKDNFFKFIYIKEGEETVEGFKFLNSSRLGEEFVSELNEEITKLVDYVAKLRGERLNFERYTDLEFLVNNLQRSINMLNSFYKVITKL